MKQGNVIELRENGILYAYALVIGEYSDSSIEVTVLKLPENNPNDLEIGDFFIVPATHCFISKLQISLAHAQYDTF